MWSRTSMVRLQWVNWFIACRPLPNGMKMLCMTYGCVYACSCQFTCRCVLLLLGIWWDILFWKRGINSNFSKCKIYILSCLKYFKRKRYLIITNNNKNIKIWIFISLIKLQLRSILILITTNTWTDLFPIKRFIKYKDSYLATRLLYVCICARARVE